MTTLQCAFTLPSMPRGFHLVTDLILRECSEIAKIECGLFHLFIQHTSASITINEDADPTVRTDFESHFNELVPENASYFVHTYEGPDDMPAHLKASLLGSSISVPITNGGLALGTWQGIYLCEHRNHASPRSFVATLMGSLFE